MEKIKSYLKDSCIKYSEILLDISNDNIKEISGEINCTNLDDKFISNNIEDDSNFKELYRNLKNIDNKPCLYYFKILSDIKPEFIYEKFKVFSETKIRKTPAIYKTVKTSNILYVGKVNSCIVGRITTHLGFLTKKENEKRIIIDKHGLQLCHWAKDINLKLQLNIFVFENKESKDLMEVLEKQLAIKLNPIIGKHK